MEIYEKTKKKGWPCFCLTLFLLKFVRIETISWRLDLVVLPIAIQLTTLVAAEAGDYIFFCAIFATLQQSGFVLFWWWNLVAHSSVAMGDYCLLCCSHQALQQDQVVPIGSLLTGQWSSSLVSMSLKYSRKWYLDKVCLEKRCAIFRRQALMCHYLLDHP